MLPGSTPSVSSFLSSDTILSHPPAISHYVSRSRSSVDPGYTITRHEKGHIKRPFSPGFLSSGFAYAEYLSSADRAFTLSCRTAVLHYNGLWVLYFSLRSTLDTVCLHFFLLRRIFTKIAHNWLFVNTLYSSITLMTHNIVGVSLVGQKIFEHYWWLLQLFEIR